ncbi:MAG: hypothetical protein B7Y99_11280 [Caulobacterales bacterium 32-69-10]|nr:MAG: hypothetical protein B7Y99_11280 [Caulobacterales bacterium 32-69-10]
MATRRRRFIRLGFQPCARCRGRLFAKFARQIELIRMAKGVQDFVGSRLEEARLARGLTQTSLAQMVERSSSTISSWESGRQVPEPDAIESLASKLNVRPSLFLRQSPPSEAMHFYRSNSTLTLGLRKKAEARLQWAKHLFSELEEWVDFPEPDFPRLGPVNYRLIDEAQIEECARDCRARWGLGTGPIADVIGTLETAGAIVVREELGGLKMDGVSAWCGLASRPFVLLAEDKASAVRSRFDAAHELGHLILHEGVDPGELSTSEYAELESQAHRFASAFLLPAESFMRDLNAIDLESFIILKRKWKVSVAAMIIRCFQMDVISEEYKSKLYKYMSARGWRRSEPLDDVLIPEVPQALSAAVKLVIEAEKYTRDGILEAVGLNAADAHHPLRRSASGRRRVRAGDDRGPVGDAGGAGRDRDGDGQGGRAQGLRPRRER